LNVNNILKVIRGIVRLRGATDNTLIGNVSDRLLSHNYFHAEVSTGNSTTLNLGSSGVFTGSWIDILEFNNVVITVITSHASATDGLIVQWSNDGSNVHSVDNFTINANAGKQFSFGRLTRYFRVVYTNGATPQTSFSLQTILCVGALKTSSHRMRDAIVNDDDAELVKAVITGREPTTGDFINIGVVGDRLKVETAVAPNITFVNSFSNKLVYNDMNASNGGVARDTSITDAAYTTVFSYTGSGYLAAFILNLETKPDWIIRLIVDGADVLIPDTPGILSDDITSNFVYDLDLEPESSSRIGFLWGANDRLIWTSPLGISMQFSSSATIQLRRVTGKLSKKFRAGLIALSKET